MRKHDAQGTSFKENWQMFVDELRWGGRPFHKLLNIFVELVRANPKYTVYLIVGLIVTLAAALI